MPKGKKKSKADIDSDYYLYKIGGNYKRPRIMGVKHNPHSDRVYARKVPTEFRVTRSRMHWLNQEKAQQKIPRRPELKCILCHRRKHNKPINHGLNHWIHCENIDKEEEPVLEDVAFYHADEDSYLMD